MKELRKEIATAFSEKAEHCFALAKLYAEVQTSYLNTYGERYADTVGFRKRELSIAVLNLKGNAWLALSRTVYDFR